MTERCAKSWSEPERALLDGILAQLIPASRDGRIPSAATLGVAQFLAARISRDRDLESLFKQGLAAAHEIISAGGRAFDQLDGAGQVSIVARLEQQQPKFFSALLRHTYMGYYSDPIVRPLFGLAAEPTQPHGYEVPAEAPELLAALVEPVQRRGPCFRES